MWWWSPPFGYYKLGSFLLFHFVSSSLSPPLADSLDPRMAVSAQLAQEWLGDDYEDEDVVYFDQEEEDDDDDYGPGVTIFNAPPSPEPEPTTDLAEQAYTDPLALVNAWEGALQDYKVGGCLPVDNPVTNALTFFFFLCSDCRQDSHPDQFLPPAEAPRTLAQKRVKAPLYAARPLVPDQAVC